MEALTSMMNTAQNDRQRIAALNGLAVVTHPDIELLARPYLTSANKEALANAIKYSGCQEIRVCYKANDHGFTLSVLDNGCGFEIERTSPLGNGICNMRQRLADIGGECRIESKPGKGTCVSFIFETLKG